MQRSGLGRERAEAASTGIRPTADIRCEDMGLCLKPIAPRGTFTLRSTRGDKVAAAEGVAADRASVAFWLISGFIRRLMTEIDEAARLDGANHFTVVWRIIASVIRPGLAATALICGILAFDEFLLASSFSSDASSCTLPSRSRSSWANGLSISARRRWRRSPEIAPVYLIRLFAQRWPVGGLTCGSIK